MFVNGALADGKFFSNKKVSSLYTASGLSERVIFNNWLENVGRL